MVLEEQSLIFFKSLDNLAFQISGVDGAKKLNSFIDSAEFDSLLNLLDEVSDVQPKESTVPPNPAPPSAPPSNSSSTCHLAIDDDNSPIHDFIDEIPDLDPAPNEALETHNENVVPNVPSSSNKTGHQSLDNARNVSANIKIDPQNLESGTDQGGPSLETIKPSNENNKPSNNQMKDVISKNDQCRDNDTNKEPLIHDSESKAVPESVTSTTEHQKSDSIKVKAKQSDKETQDKVQNDTSKASNVNDAKPTEKAVMIETDQSDLSDTSPNSGKSKESTKSLKLKFPIIQSKDEGISQVVAKMNQEFEVQRRGSRKSSANEHSEESEYDELASIRAMLASRGTAVVSNEVITMNNKDFVADAKNEGSNKTNVIILNNKGFVANPDANAEQVDETIGYVDASALEEESIKIMGATAECNQVKSPLSEDQSALNQHKDKSEQGTVKSKDIVKTLGSKSEVKDQHLSEEPPEPNENKDDRQKESNEVEKAGTKVNRQASSIAVEQFLRRSSRPRKIPNPYAFEEAQAAAAALKPAKKAKKSFKTCKSKLIPTMSTLVLSNTRNLQLVNPISDTFENQNVTSYLQHLCCSYVLPVNAIDQAAESTNVDLNQVSLGQIVFQLDQPIQDEPEIVGESEVLMDKEASKNVLKEHIIEDSIERAILSASKSNEVLENEVILAAANSTTSMLNLEENSVLKTPPKKKQMTPIKENIITDSLEQDLIKVAESLNKTPKKSVIPVSTASMESISLSDIFKTPNKMTPIKTLHMSEESKEKALSLMFKTPVKDAQAVQAAAESLLKKTPLNKLKKKSPMPSPFLLSPGTPAKDVSIASISFHQDESLMVTPSVQVDSDKPLTLEISPSGSLRTPSPNSTGTGM